MPRPSIASHAVTGGDATAKQALALLARVDLSRVTAPGVFIADLMDIAHRLYGEADDRGVAPRL